MTVSVIIVILALVLALVSIFVAFLFRKGSKCKVSTPDPNASKYERAKLFGKCVIKTCKTGFKIDDGKCVEENGDPVENGEPLSVSFQTPQIQSVSWI